MRFSPTFFIAIAIFSTIKAAANSNELSIVRHASKNDGSTQKLTCLSEDDGSALIWNYDREETDRKIFTDFEPEKLSAAKDTDCGIWHSTRCSVKWGKKNGWGRVDSFKNPMGPVFDYRWEGFRELTFEKSADEEGYEYVGELRGSPKTMVVSVRGSKAAHIFLCQGKYTWGKKPCLWVDIGGLQGDRVEIKFCDRKAPEARRAMGESSCSALGNRQKPNENLITSNEWRTFRLQWDEVSRTITVFKETEIKAYYSRYVYQAQNQDLSNVSIRSSKSTRVRFHSYEYWRSVSKRSEPKMSTKYFEYYKNFCVRLLVGLCNECKLDVILVDKDEEKPVKIARITGDADSVLTGTMTWKSVVIEPKLEGFESRVVRLEIAGDRNVAIDKFHTCQSKGSLRASTVKIDRNKLKLYSKSGLPEISCQKLSYNENSNLVVDGLSTKRISSCVDGEIREVIHKLYESCGFRCERFDANSSLCYSTGCSCAEEIDKINCAAECPEHTGGSSRPPRSDSESTLVSNNENLQCQDVTLLPPRCEEALGKPTVTVRGTKAVEIKQEVKLTPSEKLNSLDFFVRFGSGLKPTWTAAQQISDSSTWELNITHVEWNSTYSVNAVAYVRGRERSMTAQSPSTDFTTISVYAVCFIVTNRTKETITLDVNSTIEGCGAFCQGAGITLYCNGAPKYNPRLPHTFEKLTSSNTYELKVEHQTLGTIYQASVKTRDDEPGKVRDLKTTNVNDTFVTLTWRYPERGHSDDIKYKVTIKMKSFLGCKNYTDVTLSNDTVKYVRDPRIDLRDLHPYAKYVAYVSGITYVEGPNESKELQTTQTSVPRSVVSNLEIDEERKLLKWKKPEDCTTITGNTVGTNLTFIPYDSNVKGTYDRVGEGVNSFNFGHLELIPNTNYEVRVYVIGENGTINETSYAQKRWKIPPSAPTMVTNLEIYDADSVSKSISLRWKPPNPPRGELEAYYVSIEREETSAQNFTIKSTEGICKLWENYVCFENIEDLKDVPADKGVEIKVWAKNKDVTDNGTIKTVSYAPEKLYNEPPGTPLNFTAIYQHHGIVTIKWKPPLITPTKITHFQVNVTVVERFLYDGYSQFPITFNYTFEKEKEEYSYALSLLPSTKYNFTICSINQLQGMSNTSNASLSVPASLGFASEEKAELKNNGSLIEIKIPQIINATSNTTLKVLVEGPSTCTPRKSSFSEKMDVVLERWEAAEHKVKTNMSELVQISIEQHQGVEYTCSLDREKIYTISFELVDGFSMSRKSSTPSEISLTDRGAGILGSKLVWLIIALSILICLIIIVVTYSVRRKLRRKTSGQEIFQLKRTIASTGSSAAPDTLMPEVLGFPNATENGVSITKSSPDVVPYNPNSYPVRVEDFEEYTKNALENGLLDEQFETFAKGVDKPCDYGTLPENALKNRYKDRLPYDDTRVVLESIPGIPNSDYINANYMHGYRKRRAYIATQGPKLKTVKDFWRMIWENEVQVICMLANVMEAGKKKCEQYWPDIGTKLKYGDFLIENQEHKVFADYTFRKFTISYKKIVRTITHLHYTGWPDHGVPIYTQSLVVYLKKLLATSSGNAPIVVHCSAGVGRTGTIILCDICLRQAHAERIIDVPSAMIKMREDRVGMVDNAQQYLLAHLAIVESMIVEQTQIPCDDFLPQRITGLRKQLPLDMRRLEYAVWQDRALHSLELAWRNNAEENGEYESGLVSETSGVDGKDVIKAISVDGVKMKKQYLTSQLPSKSTIDNFWKLIAEKRIELVVILQRPDQKNSRYCDLTLGKSTINPVPGIRVATKEVLSEKEYFTTKKLLLTEETESECRTQPVTVLTCTGWGNGKNGKPPTAAALVKLWIASEKISRKESSTFVLCHDGVTASGLYLALNFLLERMAVEKECDVISAVRAIRRSNIEFVKSLQQFQYLYDAAMHYIECFETYANFT